jgi:hypothetical protein
MPRSVRIAEIFNRDLFGYQQDIADDPNSDVVVTCGRQVGKTETAGAIAADAALFKPGEDVMVAARWQETADETMRRMVEHFDRANKPREAFGVEKDNEREWVFTNGSRVYSRNLESASGLDVGDTERGKVPKTVIVDESAMLNDAVFEEVINPMFATFGGSHELYLLSTPRGKTGYHYEKHKLDDDWNAHHVPTAANPLVDDEWLEKKRQEVDKLTWRQEYLGEFVEAGDDKYLPNELVMPCVRDDDPNERAALNAETTYLGVDVARAGDDRTVYIVMDEAGDVVRVESEETSKMTGVVGRIKRLDSEYDFARVNIDENAVGGGVVDFAEHDLGGKINPVAFSNESKQEMYQALKRCLEDKELSLPDHGRLVHELTALEYDFTPTGKLKVEHPPGGHDDFADAVALANLARVKTNTSGLRRTTSTGPTKGSMR